MRRPVIAGNWKMHKTIGEAVLFVKRLKPLVAEVNRCDIVIAPPFTALRAVAEAIRGSNIGVAAQDVHWAKEGAHTGEISCSMLLDAGCTSVVIGHSERRHDHGETDELVNRKLKAALRVSLAPIVCVGETLAQREAGDTEQILEAQFQRGFAGLTAQEFSLIMIAYEPVWAIGTGRTASPQMAAESHRTLRMVARQHFGEEPASRLRILYGGSVKPDNIGALMAEQDIDGALVGGASLEVESFSAIVHYPRA